MISARRPFQREVVISSRMVISFSMPHWPLDRSSYSSCKLVISGIIAGDGFDKVHSSNFSSFFNCELGGIQLTFQNRFNSFISSAVTPIWQRLDEILKDVNRSPLFCDKDILKTFYSRTSFTLSGTCTYP